LSCRCGCPEFTVIGHTPNTVRNVEVPRGHSPTAG
jgi:hypothetical protein